MARAWRNTVSPSAPSIWSELFKACHGFGPSRSNAETGFRQFAMVSHDRGARVGHRLALDHPDRLTKLVMMDICPTYYMYKTADREFASAYFHWFFLILPAPFPETLIGNNVDAVLKLFMGRVMPKSIEPDAYAEYRRCFSDPATIHASCEDYRAAASIGLVQDESVM